VDYNLCCTDPGILQCYLPVRDLVGGVYQKLPHENVIVCLNYFKVFEEVFGGEKIGIIFGKQNAYLTKPFF
jgi:hypothetical protein